MNELKVRLTQQDTAGYNIYTPFYPFTVRNEPYNLEQAQAMVGLSFKTCLIREITNRSEITNDNRNPIIAYAVNQISDYVYYSLVHGYMMHSQQQNDQLLNTVACNIYYTLKLVYDESIILSYDELKNIIMEISEDLDTNCSVI